MKKILLLILCLSIIFILVGCGSDKNTTTSTKETNENRISQDNSKESNNTKKETDSNNKNSTKSAETSSNANSQTIKDNINDSKKVIKVTSSVKLYEGTYFDDRRFGDNVLKNYCEVKISNITNTSFDFTIYEVNNSDGNKENKKIIFLTNTAFFTGDGTQATFNGHTYTLKFTFPNNHNASPTVTDIVVSGFQPLEGKTYVNNGISGHEFG